MRNERIANLTSEQIKTTLKIVVNTLNTVEVKGKDNINHMLGSIMTLEKVINEMNTETEVDNNG